MSREKHEAAVKAPAKLILKEMRAMQAGKSRRFTTMSAASMLMMLSCLGHGWAQTLNRPTGLALDARGNLYVANRGGNQVLVYNPNYVQQPGKSITSELSEPTGVAFDSKGNVYVANVTGNGGTGSITQYSSAGVLNKLFTDGISLPRGIAVDALDNLYVLNDKNVTIYPLADTINGPFLLTTITFPGGSYGCLTIPSACAIAAHAGDLYVGGAPVGFPTQPGFWAKGFVSEFLAGGGGFRVFQSTTTGVVVALATDSAGDLYDALSIGNANGEVDFWSPKGGPVVFLKNLATPAGIVVDSARGRVYLSSALANEVLVYNTKGTLLHSIQ
jgi:DNA-binding beta-propeller fold protein YncE